jgi:hypothetical protein
MKQAYEMVNVPPDWYVKITKFSIHVKLQVPYKRAEILQLLPWSRISPTRAAQKGIPAMPHRIFMDAVKDHIALLGTAEVFANNCILILEPTDYQLEGFAVPSWGEFRQFAYQMLGACAALIADAQFTVDGAQRHLVPCSVCTSGLGSGDYLRQLAHLRC